MVYVCFLVFWFLFFRGGPLLENYTREDIAQMLAYTGGVGVARFLYSSELLFFLLSLFSFFFFASLSSVFCNDLLILFSSFMSAC